MAQDPNDPSLSSLSTIFGNVPPSVASGFANPWDPQGTTRNMPPMTAGTSPPVTAKGIPAEGQALLRTIGGPGFESNGSYTQRFNQPDFTDFSKHPGTYGKITRGPNAGLNSNAAGRYQFLSTTFNQQKTKQGLKDFSPESQDRAAWGLAQDAYAQQMHGRSLSNDLKNPDNLPMIARALRGQWTSLPGGTEQGGDMRKFTQAFQSNLTSSQAPTGVARAPAAPPAQEVGFPQDPWIIRGNMPTTQFAGGLGI